MAFLWVFLIFISIIYGLIRGRMGEISAAILELPTNVIELTLVLGGTAILWNGILNILYEAGFVKKMTRMMKPILIKLMPNIDSENCLNNITLNLSANFLGLGNAAMGAGLEASKSLNSSPELLYEFEVFIILNHAGISILPLSVFTLLVHLNHPTPLLFLPFSLLASVLTLIISVLLHRFLKRVR